MRTALAMALGLAALVGFGDAVLAAPPAAGPAPTAHPAAAVPPSVAPAARALPASPGLASASPGASLTSLPAAADDIRDIRAPLEVPEPFPWVAVLMGALAAAAAATWLWRHRPRRAARRLSPLEATLARLKNARADAELGAEAFAAEVSDAVRDYLVAAWRLPADRRTTEEFLYELAHDRGGASPVAGQRPQLAALLVHCDLAKYAAWELDHPDREAIAALAERFLRDTEAARQAAEAAAREAATARAADRRPPRDVSPPHTPATQGA